MNIKIKTLFFAATLATIAFAQDTTVTESATPAAESAAPAEESAPPALEPAAADEITASAVGAETSATTEVQPAVVEPQPLSDEESVAPVAVRNGATPQPTVDAPRTVRNSDMQTEGATTIVYETVYTNEEGMPVRKVYMARRVSNEEIDEISMVPMKFKLGLHGDVGSYSLSGNTWDSDSYTGMSWRAGLTSIIPLNAYTMGIKLGVLFSRSDAKATYNYVDNDSNGDSFPVSISFDQMKIDIPVLFTFKSSISRFMFDLGTMVSVPIKDQMKYSYTDSKNAKHVVKADMIDDDFRNSLDWNLVFGFSLLANDYISLDMHANLGLSDHYEGRYDFIDVDLSSSSFGIGVTVYPF
ncbi:MAG: PorT family protein [Fibrobacter sp.]|nr:PorT family protein [Fibrobacter sp.]